MAFDAINELKNKNLSEKEAISKIHNEFGINRITLSQWYSGKYRPLLAREANLNVSRSYSMF